MLQGWLFVILVPQAVLPHSIQFGMMHYTAVPIFEAEIYTNRSGDVDVVFKQKGHLIFYINLILIVDESQVEWNGGASIVNGGIGCNFTSLRLLNIQMKVSRLSVLIYGTPR
ncbi:uncharacterized protein [Drosophila bipectinata]|uniref:uncharacterized protein n=1 Tax=Drosophila bipectinata TaxID=42026 RepID=UPI001C88FE4A|nr:uncharacterized protein LOC122321120 [Drosophila bipectinata]